MSLQKCCFYLQPSHRRGRSLSEALTLEQLEEGGVVISSINNVSSGKGLKEGMNLDILLKLLFVLFLTF